MRGGERVRTLRRATRSAERIEIANNALLEASSKGRGLMAGWAKCLTPTVITTHAVGKFVCARGLRRGVVE